MVFSPDSTTWKQEVTRVSKNKSYEIAHFSLFSCFVNYLHLEELIRGRLEQNKSAVLSPLKTKKELTSKKEINAQVDTTSQNAGMQTKSLFEIRCIKFLPL